MTINEAIEYLKKLGYTVTLNEDFGIGVGGPCGLDQGIPHGGDGKGCCPQRMGLYQRSPYSINPLYNGVPDAHHPDYWLRQIPKKKKRKKRAKRKLSESIITDQVIMFKEACWRLYYKMFGKQDEESYNFSTHELRKEFNIGFNSDLHNLNRPATFGHSAGIITRYLNGNEENDNIKKCVKMFKDEIKRLNKYL